MESLSLIELRNILSTWLVAKNNLCKMSRFLNFRMFVNFMKLHRKSVDIWLCLLLLSATIVQSRGKLEFHRLIAVSISKL